MIPTMALAAYTTLWPVRNLASKLYHETRNVKRPHEFSIPALRRDSIQYKNLQLHAVELNEGDVAPHPSYNPYS